MDERSRQFDPDMVDALVALLDQKTVTLRDYAERSVARALAL